MPTYLVQREDGSEVKRGDVVVSFRGERYYLDAVTRGPQPGKSAKVQVRTKWPIGTASEFYAGIFNLTVTEKTFLDGGY